MDIGEFFDGVDVFDGEAGLEVLGGGGEFGDDAVNLGLAGGWADNYEVGAGGLYLGGDELADTTHEGEDEDDTGDADGDAEAGEEGAGAIATEGTGGEFVVGTEEDWHYFLAPFFLDFLDLDFLDFLEDDLGLESWDLGVLGVGLDFSWVESEIGLDWLEFEAESEVEVVDGSGVGAGLVVWGDSGVGSVVLVVDFGVGFLDFVRFLVLRMRTETGWGRSVSSTVLMSVSIWPSSMWMTRVA